MKINTVYCVRIYIGSFSSRRRGEDKEMRCEHAGGGQGDEVGTCIRLGRRKEMMGKHASEERTRKMRWKHARDRER